MRLRPQRPVQVLTGSERSRSRSRTVYRYPTTTGAKIHEAFIALGRCPVCYSRLKNTSGPSAPVASFTWRALPAEGTRVDGTDEIGRRRIPLAIERSRHVDVANANISVVDHPDITAVGTGED